MNLPIRNWLDKVLSQMDSEHSFHGKTLFLGEGVGGIASYVAGWMAGKGIDVIIVDGANRFDPYIVSSFARRVLIPPERLLKKIQIARAFTCYQMTTLMGERLFDFLRKTHTCQQECGVPSTYGCDPSLQKPWVIILGPVTTFLDEDVPEREVWPLFERALRKLEEMVRVEGNPLFMFQPHCVHWGRGRTISSKRPYLVRRLFQFSDLVWKISLEDQGFKMILEKGLKGHQIPCLSAGWQPQIPR